MELKKKRIVQLKLRKIIFNKEFQYFDSASGNVLLFISETNFTFKLSHRKYISFIAQLLDYPPKWNKEDVNYPIQSYLKEKYGWL